MRQIRAEYPNNLLYKYYFLYHFNEKSTKSEPPLPPYTVLHDKDVHTCLFKKVVTITKICERFTLYKHANRLEQIYLVNYWRCPVSWLSRVLKQVIERRHHWFLYHMQSSVRSYLDMSLFIINTNCVNVGIIFLECNLAHALYLHQTCKRGNGEKPRPACSILQLHKLSQNLHVLILCLKFKTLVPSTPVCMLWRNIQDVLDPCVLYAITETGF